MSPTERDWRIQPALAEVGSESLRRIGETPFSIKIQSVTVVSVSREDFLIL